MYKNNKSIQREWILIIFHKSSLFRLETDMKFNNLLLYKMRLVVFCI